MNLGLDKLGGVAERISKLPPRMRMAALVAVPLLIGGAYFQPARAGDQDLYVARFTLD